MPEILAELPPDLLQELRDSILILDRETISAVVERTEPLAPDLAKSLRILLGDFQIDQILILLGEDDEN